MNSPSVAAEAERRRDGAANASSTARQPSGASAPRIRREQLADLGRAEMVHQVEAEHHVVRAAEVGRQRVAVAVPDPVGQARRPP